MEKKKKILLSLGALPILGAVIIVPTSFAISSKKETLAGKFMDTINSNINISKSDKSLGEIYGWLKDPKSAKEGKTYSSNDNTAIALENILQKDLLKSKENNSLIESKLKEFESKSYNEAKKDMQFTILKGFSNDSIKVKMQTALTIIKPEIKNLGTASKDITIHFTA